MNILKTIRIINYTFAIWKKIPFTLNVVCEQICYPS